MRSFLGARGRNLRQFCTESSARPMDVSPCGGSGVLSSAERKRKKFAINVCKEERGRVRD